jgi:hypothetical protein
MFVVWVIPKRNYALFDRLFTERHEKPSSSQHWWKHWHMPSEEVPEDSRVLSERHLWFPTSDRLETCLILSGTTRSRQYHESSMVWHNLPRATAFGTVFCCFDQNSVTNGKQALLEVVRGQVASDHGWLVMLSRPGRSGEEEPGFEAIGGWET